ncbi:unnamed protein product, partial [Vitis vinifera]
MISVKTVKWSSNITGGKKNHVSISYTSSSHNLSVVLITEVTNSTNTTQSLSYKVDLREYLPENVSIGFSAATGDLFQMNKICSWKFSSTLEFPSSVEPGEGKKTGLMVGLNQEDGADSDLAMDEDFEKGTGPRKFSFYELALATSNFAEEQKLGEGGFGGVYRGFLRELNSYVAVKRVSRNSQQGMKEYASEVKIFCRLRHRNLVQLMGWLVDHGKGSQTTVLSGTMGYMAPECFVTGKASKESDVYSFGIIRLVEWVWDLYGVGKLLEAADPRLSADYDEQQMERLMIVGLWCAHPDCNARPSMRQAISVLNSEALLPLLPIKMPVPMYYAPPALQTSYSTSVSERNHTQFSNSSNGTTDSSKFSESSPILSQFASVLHTR